MQLLVADLLTLGFGFLFLDILVFRDPHLGQRDQVVVCLYQQLLHLVEQEQVVGGEFVQAGHIAPDSVANLTCVDLCPGQFVVGGVAQTADHPLAFDDSGEICRSCRHTRFATQ
nr:hypothetical protein [uncultured Pseudomonas sp.]